MTSKRVRWSIDRVTGELIEELLGVWGEGCDLTYCIDVLAVELARSPWAGSQYEAEICVQLQRKLGSSYRELPDLLRWYLADEQVAFRASIRLRMTPHTTVEPERLQKREEYRGLRELALADLLDVLGRDFRRSEEYWESELSEWIPRDEFQALQARFVEEWAQKRGLDHLPDEEQLSAIGSTWKNTIVVARAGSGKTDTIVNRCLFLIDRCGVPPESVLVLAFNAQAAAVARDRIASMLSGPQPHVMTFHALAHAVVKPSEQLLADESDRRPVLSRVVQGCIDEYRRGAGYDLIRDLMMSRYRGDWTRIEHGGFNLEKQELYRYRLGLQRESLAGDYVRSDGEKVIANFLFEHDIPYIYEKPFYIGGVTFRPDFYLTEQKIVIEYFGMLGDPDYDELTADKKTMWSRRPERFVGIDRTDHGSLVAELKSRLVGMGVPVRRLPEREIWRRIEMRAIDRLTKAVTAFLSRVRSRGWLPEDLRRQIEIHETAVPDESVFLSLALEIYARYLAICGRRGLDDFSGLIMRATDALKSGKTRFESRWSSGDLARLRYVMIDEYQDFSPVFNDLTDEIIRASGANLCAVGDDWQSIYGFAGADHVYFGEFESRTVNSRRLYLSTNYRSLGAIVQAGNAVMSGNGRRGRTKLGGGRVLLADTGNLELSEPELEHWRGDRLTAGLCRIVRRELAAGRHVAVLSRTKKAVEQTIRKIHEQLPDFQQEMVSGCTAHNFKGQQRDSVVILDASARKFPMLHPDSLFVRIFGEEVEDTIEQERRLFYVAVTRARSNLFFLLDDTQMSPFLEDIERTGLLEYLDWTEWDLSDSPVRGTQIIVKNRTTRGGGTWHIKHALATTQFRWSAARRCWWRQVPEDSLECEAFLAAAEWIVDADAVEVLFVRNGRVPVVYHVDGGIARYVSGADELDCPMDR